VLHGGAGNRWSFVKPPYGAADYGGASETDTGKPPTGVKALLTAVTGLRVEGKSAEIGRDKKEKKEPEKDRKKASGFVEDNAKDPDGEEVELVRKAGPSDGFQPANAWTMYRGKEKKGLATDTAAVDRLVSSLSQKRVVREFLGADDKNDAALGLKDPNVVVSV